MSSSLVVIFILLYPKTKRGRKPAKLEGVCRREQSPNHTESHSFTHTNTHMSKRKGEKITHTETETDRQFIPYFSETETSGDIISDRERKRDSVEEAKRRKKNSFSFLVVDLCQKQTNRTSATSPRSFSFSESARVCERERKREGECERRALRNEREKSNLVG